LIELDNLDKLEFIDGSISLLNNTKDFVEGLLGSPALSQNVNVQEFIEYLKDQLRLLGLEDLVLMKPRTTPQPGMSQSPLAISPGDGDEEEEEEEQAGGEGQPADDQKGTQQ